MTKDKAEQEKVRIERTSGGGELGGTSYGQQPGEATHSDGKRGGGADRRRDGSEGRSGADPDPE